MSDPIQSEPTAPRSPAAELHALLIARGHLFDAKRELYEAIEHSADEALQAHLRSIALAADRTQRELSRAIERNFTAELAAGGCT